MKTIRSSGAVKCESRSVMSVSLWPHGLCSPWNSLGQNTGVSSLSLLQGIFPNQGLIPGLPHCRTLYQLSLKGSPRILEWVAYTFSSRSSQPRDQTGVSCIAGRFFASWAIREARNNLRLNMDLNPGPSDWCYTDWAIQVLIPWGKFQRSNQIDSSLMYSRS